MTVLLTERHMNFATVLSNRDVMPLFTAVCGGIQWMAVRRNSIAENFGSRTFKSAQ
jgi:hypothetical protein